MHSAPKMTVNCMNFIVEQRPFSILLRLRSMELTRKRSEFLCIAHICVSHLRFHREEIGILTSLPLLRKIVGDLEMARNNGGSSLTLYFTKESHIHTLMNLLLLSGLPIANRRIPELDYAVGHFPSLYSNIKLTFPSTGAYNASSCFWGFFALVLTKITGLSCTNAITDAENQTKSTPSNSL
jgi:hypothetical protein